MSARHIASEVTAALSLICWALVPVPQVIKNYRSGTTEGLSPFLCVIWTFNGVLVASYGVAMGLSAFLIAQPFVTGCFLMLALFQIFYLDRFNRQWVKSLMIVLVVVVVNLGIFAGLVFGLRRAVEIGVKLDFFAYLTTVVGLSGMVPQYWETWKFQRVLGLSLGLCFLDMSGSIFGAVSVLIKTVPELDVASFVLFVVYAPFVGMMIPLHYILEARWRRLHPEGSLDDVELGEDKEGKKDEERTLSSLDKEAVPNVAQLSEREMESTASVER